MALNSSEQQAVAQKLAKIAQSSENLAALASGCGLRYAPPSQEMDATAFAIHILETAARQGELNQFIKCCLQKYPGDDVLMAALSGDPRFSGEASRINKRSWLPMAMSLRTALQTWEPTHVMALDDDLQQLGTLLAGVLEEAKLLTPPVGKSFEHIWDQLSLLDDDIDPARVVLLASHRPHLQLALQLFERSNLMAGLQIRPVGPAQMDTSLPLPA